MHRTAIGISACLLGQACRYDGASKVCAAAQALAADPRFDVVPVCPEALGGLSTPRPPHEIVRGKDGEARLLDEQGSDHTQAFLDGAHATLALLQDHGCIGAVLKARSPSCGRGYVYDGTFSGTLVEGDGVTAALLMDAGIRVITEEDLGRGGIDTLLG